MAKKETQEFITDPMLTVEGQKQKAREVDQGESARELLEQALPYVGNAGFKDYSGSPDYALKLRERIEAYLLLNQK